MMGLERDYGWEIHGRMWSGNCRFAGVLGDIESKSSKGSLDEVDYAFLKPMQVKTCIHRADSREIWH